MRNFLAFIQRFRVLLVFAILQGVALSIYFTFISYPRAQFFTTASNINGATLKMRNELTKHFNLSHNNQQLQKENSRLRALLKQSNYKLDNSKITINDTSYKRQYDFIPAVVINSTYDKRNNYFTLNIGSKAGIKRGMGVFSDKGVIGVVHNTSEHYAVVKSCLTENINIDVMVEKTGQFGLLKWNGKDARRGTMWGVSNDTRVKKWSKIVTRGGGGMFPPGIPIGKISKASPVEGQPLWDLTILYSEDYRRVRNVYVITNLMRTEQETLENQIDADN
jgi:rod shape-determining protein MreC